MATFRFTVEIPDEQIRWVADELHISFAEARGRVRHLLELASDVHLYREPRLDEEHYLEMVDPDADDQFTFSGRERRPPSRRILPDLTQCQADKSNGVTFMTLGGIPRLVRCTNKPAYVATENRPGDDGRIGSMSLCHSCRVAYDKMVPDDLATVVPTQQYVHASASAQNSKRE